MRNSALKLMGFGLGNVSRAGLLRAIGGVMVAIGSVRLTIATEAAPLEDVPNAWQCEEMG
ncbi:MAG: hypothetical protein ACRESJ_01965 [Pseudomonas sp.]|uniref:hypothetical protein n=1 Tax=Pseudomonas sp. TaxID=306 RepID=UPI003D6FDFB7